MGMMCCWGDEACAHRLLAAQRTAFFPPPFRGCAGGTARDEPLHSRSALTNTANSDSDTSLLKQREGRREREGSDCPGAAGLSPWLLCGACGGAAGTRPALVRLRSELPHDHERLQFEAPLRWSASRISAHPGPCASTPVAPHGVDADAHSSLFNSD